MGGEDYVLRICGKDTAVLGIDRDAECAATMAAARIGVGPGGRRLRPDLEVLVTRWVEGRACDRGGAALARRCSSRSPRRCAPCTAGRRSPRASTPFALVERIPRRGRSTRGGRGAGRLRRGRAARPRASRAIAAGPRPRAGALPQRPAARELPRTTASGVRIVDWEYAGMGDRFFDLGNLAVNNDFGDGRRGAPARGLLRRARRARRLRGAAPDARDVRLPRGDVGRRCRTSCQRAGLRLRRLRDEHFERLLAAVRATRVRGASPMPRPRELPDRARVVIIGGGVGGARSPTTCRSSASATSCCSTATS